MLELVVLFVLLCVVIESVVSLMRSSGLRRQIMSLERVVDGRGPLPPYRSTYILMQEHNKIVVELAEMRAALNDLALSSLSRPAPPGEPEL